MRRRAGSASAVQLQLRARDVAAETNALPGAAPAGWPRPALGEAQGQASAHARQIPAPV